MAENRQGAWSRRRFLKMVGATAGGPAVLNAMSAWGMFPAAALAQTEPPQLEGHAEGTSVIVIGTGSGGSAAAYDLINLGYDITILEAQDRVGGHAFTVRGGSRTFEHGKGEQVCDWDDGVWYDAGPSRVPFFHRAFFHYAKELNTPLIDYNNLNDHAWTYAEGIDGSLDGERMRLATLKADMAGYTSMLLAKASESGGLDEDLSEEDAEMLREYLITWGMLSRDDLEHTASGRRGYTSYPGTQSGGEYDDPYPLSDLLPFANAVVGANAGYIAAVPSSTWRSTLVTTPDGIGHLFDVGFRNFFSEQLGENLRLNSEVTGIENTEDGVTVTYTDRESGEEQQVSADYCICNIPLSVLIKLNTNFSSEFTEAMQSVPYAMALRMGAQFNSRFWETDDWIYGGQSFSNISELGILGYPNNDYTADKGAMLIMYNFGTNAARISSLSYEERAEVALEHMSKLHPQAREHFHSAFSVAWHLEPYALGAWPSYTQASRDRYMPILQEPEGNVYLVGEHLSYVNSWMEGAFQSAWLQVPKLHERVMNSSS